jgi:hypothetical protein
VSLTTFDFEAGTNGATITTGTTGANQIVLNGGTGVFDNSTDVWSGSLAVKITSGVSALAIMRLLSGTTNKTMSFGGGFVVWGTPAVQKRIMTIRHTSGSAADVNWETNNNLTIGDTGHGNLVTIATGLTPGNMYWLSIRAVAATTSTGSFTANVYDSTGTFVAGASSSTFNLNTNNLTGGDFGIVNTNSTTATSVSWDDVNWNDGSTVEITPPVSAPVVTTGALGVNAALSGSPVTVATGSGSIGVLAALTSTVSTVAVAAGALGVALALTGSASTVYTTTGNMSVNAGMNSTAQTVAVATGSLTTNAALTGQAVTVYTTTGSLSVAAGLAGTASTVATSTGHLSVLAALTGIGAQVGQYVTTGNLPVMVTLAGTGSTVASTTGSLTAAVALTGTASTVASHVTNGALTASLALTGVASTVTVTTGELNLTTTLHGVAVNPGQWHDITVTASLDPQHWQASLDPARSKATLDPKRWEATL